MTQKISFDIFLILVSIAFIISNFKTLASFLKFRLYLIYSKKGRGQRACFGPLPVGCQKTPGLKFFLRHP